MSKCVVHMQKMKMSAIGGIQSHNQREHESKKNHEIDYAKSGLNVDLLNGERINYQQELKERIADLGLKKAVRKDATVYCSFIVSSDKEFFEVLGAREHEKRQFDQNMSVALGIQQASPFEYMGEEYQTECIRAGALRYFQEAMQFFIKRYGGENLINATVHFDEATPHMHLGIVPVTEDGRLSAKDLFTPLELKQLQTDFAREVGSKYDLERGKEGSEAKHLDEVSYKLQKRSEQLETLSGEVNHLEAEKNALESQIERLGVQQSTLEEEIGLLDKAIKGKRQEAVEQFGSVAEMQRAVEQERKVSELEKKLSLFERFMDAFPQVRTLWEQFQNNHLQNRQKQKGKEQKRE
jgi:hypothetical protein